jgi:hypothetical protein
MEPDCLYVSSRGIAKMCSFFPEIIKSDSIGHTEYLLNLIDKQFDGMSIYVISNLLSIFVTNILPKINKKFILVSGCSVKTCPVEVLKENDFFKLMNNPHLIRWHSQNNTIQNGIKIKQIPLGLDYHTIYNNPSHKWKSNGEGCLPIEQERILLRVKQQSGELSKRINKIYVNFLPNDRFGQRKECLRQINPNLLSIHNDNLKRTDTWRLTTKYAFVLSPYGNGMDCHRTWEAIILGSIPIIKSKEFKLMFEDLPVLNVENWTDINQKLLDDTIERFKTKIFNYDKLTMNYWKNIIFS